MKLAELRDLIASDCNKNDQVITLIEACLTDGINTRKAIRETIAALGYDPRHVVIQLNENTGTNPQRHRWREDNGIYSLFD